MSNHKYLPLIIFSAAMGFLEAIVVVYIRELYYPNGFQFPLKALPSWIILVELIREISTLLMLGAVAWISGRTFLKRLSVFLLIFGIWDIIYYVALNILLGWPESLLTWDILFLIPVTWVGPVLAPVLCSILMIVMALVFDYLQLLKNITKLQTKELLLLLTGAAVIYYTFTVDFSMIILKGSFLPIFFSLAENPDFIEITTSWEPIQFKWIVFFIGITVICVGFLLIVRRGFQSEQK
jgi:hypothetical protein